MGFSLKSLGGFAKGAISKFVPYGDLAMGALSLVTGSKKSGQADKAASQASALQKQRYNDTAPLRAGALSRLTNTQRPDLSGRVSYANASNPFSQPRPLAPSMGATTPPGPEAANPMERPLRRVMMRPDEERYL